MAVTVTAFQNLSRKSLDSRTYLLAFTSTTATAEISTDLSVIAPFLDVTRVGDVKNGPGNLTIDETFTSGLHTVSTSVTIDRGESDDATVLTDENFYVTLYGQS